MDNEAVNKALVEERRYGVNVGRKHAVVGFRHPRSADEPGKGENVEREGEIRVARNCIAVLGERSTMQWSTHQDGRRNAEGRTQNGKIDTRNPRGARLD